MLLSTRKNCFSVVFLYQNHWFSTW